MRGGTGVAVPGWPHLVAWGPDLGRGFLLAGSQCLPSLSPHVVRPWPCTQLHPDAAAPRTEWVTGRPAAVAVPVGRGLLPPRGWSAGPCCPSSRLLRSWHPWLRVRPTVPGPSGASECRAPVPGGLMSPSPARPPARGLGPLGLPRPQGNPVAGVLSGAPGRGLGGTLRSRVGLPFPVGTSLAEVS